MHGKMHIACSVYQLEFSSYMRCTHTNISRLKYKSAFLYHTYFSISPFESNRSLGERNARRDKIERAQATSSTDPAREQGKKHPT